MLGLLAVLLSLASAYDLRDGEVPLLLLVLIPSLGAIHTMISTHAPAWPWRAGMAISMMIGAGMVGRLSIALRRWRKPKAGSSPIGLGAADIVLIGGAAFWLDIGNASIFGVFLMLSGVTGVLWAIIWHGFSYANGSRSQEGLPMVPPVSLALFVLALAE
jgi:hypothetical protein